LTKTITSFDIAAVIAELRRIVKIGKARISNIYQINPKTVILKIKNPGAQPLNLLIESGKRIHLTSYRIEKPLKPPPFCMALRKYLKNGIISEISQHEFERTIKIEVQTGKGKFTLIAELFGEGNIILVDPENKILHALIYKRMRDRNIVRQEEFRYAPPSGVNPLKAGIEDVKKILDIRKLEVVRALTRLFSIGGLYAEEILLRAGIDKRTPCGKLTEEGLGKIFNELRNLTLQVVSGEIQPVIVINEEGKWVDVTPIRLKRYENYLHEEFSSFNEALDEFYIKEEFKGKEEVLSKKIKEKLEELQRRLKSQEEALKRIKLEIETKKRIGDIIYAHFHELQTIFREIEELKRTGEDWTKIAEKTSIPSVKIMEIDTKKLFVTVKIGEEEFPLNIRHSIQENAAKYYSEAKKAERKLKGALKSIEETKKQIGKLERGLIEALAEEEKKAKIPVKIRKKAWYEKFRWFYSSEGFLVLGGRDATTNELLIKRYTEPHDIVFHADIAGAPFVIIKTEGKMPTEKTLKEAAQFAASFSKAWKMGLGSLDVYWVRPEQVSKGAPSGQFLKKGAFIIHGKKNYVRHVPLRIAIGITFKNDVPLVIGGSPEAISRETKTYVEIVPGDIPSGRLAKEILKILAKKIPKEKREDILRISLEDVQHFIPSGKGRIVKAD